MPRSSQKIQRQAALAENDRWLDKLFAYDEKNPYATDLHEAGPEPATVEEPTALNSYRQRLLLTLKQLRTRSR
jgi:hypothetical protein